MNIAEKVEGVRQTVLKKFDWADELAHRPLNSSRLVISNELRARIVSHAIQSQELAPLIDHTLLKPEATFEQLEHLCHEAIQFQFATVCVNGSRVRSARSLLGSNRCKPIAVVGFPLGAMSTKSKVDETRDVIEAGAVEVDMVLNIGYLKDENWKFVNEDISAVVDAANLVPVKVILETALLNETEKIAACLLAQHAGAAFVKTSTGFGGGRATVEDITLMREVVGSTMAVKASGGIRSFEDACKMIAAGADRIGTSHSVAIVEGHSSVNSGY